MINRVEVNETNEMIKKMARHIISKPKMNRAVSALPVSLNHDDISARNGFLFCFFTGILCRGLAVFLLVCLFFLVVM